MFVAITEVEVSSKILNTELGMLSNDGQSDITHNTAGNANDT